MAAEGRDVWVAWFTQAGRTARVNVARSTDGGDTFGKPVAVDEGEPLGRVDVVRLDGGEALVVWMERTEAGADILVRRVTGDGRRSAAAKVAVSSASRAAGFPRLRRLGDEAVVAWTEPGRSTRVRTAVVRLAAKR